jgi:transposase-like protein
MAGLLSLDRLFEGRHFDREIIVLCVRWYLRQRGAGISGMYATIPTRAWGQTMRT